MLKDLYRLVFPRHPVRIPIDCDRIRAVRLLDQALVPLRSRLFAHADVEGVAGRVTRERVALHRVQRMPGRSHTYKTNAWKPWLRGSFRYIGGQVHLCGEFRMHPFVQGFSIFWLASAALFTVYALAMLLFAPAFGIEEDMPLQIPATGLGLFGVGLAGIIWAWRWSEDDMAFIERWVRENTSLRTAGDEAQTGGGAGQATTDV